MISNNKKNEWTLVNTKGQFLCKPASEKEDFYFSNDVSNVHLQLKSVCIFLLQFDNFKNCLVLHASQLDKVKTNRLR